MRGLVVLLVLTACPKERTVEKLEAPPAPNLVAVPDRPPPPPPPPPPAPTRLPPPAEIVNALRGDGPIVARVHKLDDRRGGKRFMTQRERWQRVLKPAVADKLVALLLRDSYIDGVYGCGTEVFGVSITRGDRELRFMTDCGHLYLASQDVGMRHSFDGDIILFLRELAP